MNYKIEDFRRPVIFEPRQPLVQIIPVNNLIADIENCDWHIKSITDNPVVKNRYDRWSQNRQAFHKAKAAGLIEGNSWEKNYFLGKDESNQPTTSSHYTKIIPPKLKD